MNANHARPLIAFWALALAAAVITALGLHAGARDVTVPGGAPEPVGRSGAPELVLGGVLSTRPGDILTNPLTPDLWAAGTAATPAGSEGVQVSAPATPATTSTKSTKGRSHATGGGRPQTGPTDTTTVTTAAVTGNGKSHKDPPGKTKTTSTATATPTARPTTDTTQGNGNGAGADNPGKGH